MSDAKAIQWLPILMELGEDVLARILDKSPNIKSAILEARENFQAAQKEGQDLKDMGHTVTEPNPGPDPE